MMKNQIKSRLTLVNLYLEAKDAGFVCCKCSISRPTSKKEVKTLFRSRYCWIKFRPNKRASPHLNSNSSYATSSKNSLEFAS